MSKSRFFLDSNIWFSAFYSKGVCYQLINKLLDAEEELVVSQLVLEEVFRNINQKIPGALTAVRNLFANAPITVVENPPQKQINKNLQLADKKDLPILLSAVNYQCDFFVTGNSQDFYISEISSQLKIKIISPRRAVSLAAD